MNRGIALLSRLLLAAVLSVAGVSCASVKMAAAAAPVTADSSPAENGALATPPSPAPAPITVRPATPVPPAVAGEPEEADEYATAAASDPLEGLNRAVFRFNDGLYTVLLRPVSKGYQTVVPGPVRTGVGHAFDNVRYPVRLVNCVLQGKFQRAGQETGKFLVNTVGGAGGLFKVSDKIPALADVPAEDTGQTFAAWGIPHGAYLVLPVLGPSSVRDGVGSGVDYALNPVNWGIFWDAGGSWMDIPPAVNTVQSLPGELETYDLAIGNSVDPYLSARSSYLQNRDHATAQ